ncbi:MAG: replication factor C small subunit [Candidatus Aenigmarchaeota archaeon]|nr:replication factor C small subunit [Candidatus Aenigmarchaeota archaeon]
MPLEIWTEKYRPERLDQVINQTHVVGRLKAWVKEGSIPHMLFAGPAGTGKTTVSIALAKELFGERWRENFLELNASDERGIQVVRETIKEFARMKTLGSDAKIIFLDESDALTPEAQQALRRTMEKFSKVTRFILSCNYSSRLIEPIQSRCAVFRFKRLSAEDVGRFLRRVAEKEGVTLPQEGIDAIFEISEGDLRKATNLLQAASASGTVGRAQVYEVASRAQPKDVREMLHLALAGKFQDARKKLRSLLVEQGLAGDDLIQAIHKEVFDLDLPEGRKLELVDKVGETEFRLNQGGSEEIQLEALLTKFLPQR